MKKYLNYSFAYAILALVGGVFYREFTKMNDFEGVTMLGKVHTHFFLLGMILFLLVALFRDKYELEKQKLFRSFMIVYNIGLPLTGIMMCVRGIPQVLGMTLSKAADSSISGIAGIGHILTGIGILFLIISLKKSVSDGGEN